MPELEKANRMIQIFRQFDPTGSGHISTDQLQFILKRLNASEDSVKTALLTCKLNESKVNYTAFVDWVMKPKVPDQIVERKRQILLLYGPPGSGKKSMGSRFTEATGLRMLSVGDQIRASISLGNAVGMQIEGILKRGGRVPDELVLELLEKRMKLSDCKAGLILRGFPQNVHQAKLLDELLAKTNDVVTCVATLEMPEEKLVNRVVGRWMHEKSGRSYHVTLSPPKSLQPGDKPSSENMRDDLTNDPLVQREQDEKQALATISSYYQDVQPVLAQYESHRLGLVRPINADQSVEDVWAAFQGILGYFKLPNA